MLKKIVILLISGLLLVLLFARVPLVVSPRLIYTLWPIGHIVSFAFWSWLLISTNKSIQESCAQRQLLILLLITLIIGSAIELGQTFFSRTAQFDDICYNLFGALLAYLFFGKFGKSIYWLFTARISVLLLFFYLLYPALQTLKDEYQLRADFPIIAKFSSTSELTRWKADYPLAIVDSNELANQELADSSLMKATFAGEKFSRAVLRFFAGDWQGYHQLKFSIFNPIQQTRKVKLLITDQAYDKSQPNQQDRFEQWLMVEPSWNQYSIDLTEIKNAPTEREMDLGKIAGVDFYMYQLSEPVNLYFNKIELVTNVNKKP